MLRKYKQLFTGIFIGIMIATIIPAGAAVQEYLLKQSECKIVVDGIEVKGELPLLIMDPGFNYIPAAEFRSICDKIGIGFEFDVPTKEIRLTTPKKPAVVQEVKDTMSSTPNIMTLIEPVVFSTEENDIKTFWVDDVKYVERMSANVAMHDIALFEIFFIDAKIVMRRYHSYDTVLDDMPITRFIDVNGNPLAGYEYDYYINIMLPLAESERKKEAE